MSLLEITKLPTAENSVIHLHGSDNIAVARVPLAPGQTIKASTIRVEVRDPVPPGHKVALKPIAAGENVVRYGQVIGTASRDISAGDHVHVHNVGYHELAFSYEYPAGDTPIPGPRKDAPVFLGYPRADGRVGTRNYIAVVAASIAPHTPPS